MSFPTPYAVQAASAQPEQNNLNSIAKKKALKRVPFLYFPVENTGLMFEKYKKMGGIKYKKYKLISKKHQAFKLKVSLPQDRGRWQTKSDG